MERIGKAIVIFIICTWSITTLRGQEQHPPQHKADSTKHLNRSDAPRLPMLSTDSVKVGTITLDDAPKPPNLSPSTEGLIPKPTLGDAVAPPPSYTPSSEIVPSTLQVGRLRLKSFANQSNFVDLMNVKREAKTLAVALPIRKQISLTSSLTLGHTLSPYEPIPHNLLKLSVGASIQPSTNSLIGLSATYERLMGYQAWRPEVHASIYLGERWRLSATMGAAFYSPQGLQTIGASGVNYYAGARLQYALNRQWYLWGSAHLSVHRPWGGGYPPPMFGQWAPAFGGGIGVNIKDAGPIELGVTYQYNPISRRMEPIPSLNVAGVIGLLAKGIKRLFSDD